VRPPRPRPWLRGAGRGIATEGPEGARTALALVSAGLALLSNATQALAASPTASPDAAGDPRSSGQGPGLVGDPLFAIVAVVLIAAAAIVLTLAWIRLTPRREG